MHKPLENYAFIDSQNLNLGVQDLGRKLDYKKFRIYLTEKYGVSKVYMFLGYLAENQNLYRALQEYGYVLIFKPVLFLAHKGVKGNVDAELVLQAMIDLPHYSKAVIVTGDGDFHCLVKYLCEQGKLLKVLIPNRHKFSVPLRKAIPTNAFHYLAFVNDLRKRLEYTK
jgi:uncharacterized LabA/DUF88 family protein